MATPGVYARLRSRYVWQGLLGVTDNLPGGLDEWYSRASSLRIFILLCGPKYQRSASQVGNRSLSLISYKMSLEERTGKLGCDRQRASTRAVEPWKRSGRFWTAAKRFGSKDGTGRRCQTHGLKRGISQMHDAAWADLKE